MPIGITGWLVVGLKAFNAPQFIWGAVGMLIIYLWYQFVLDVMKYNEEQVDVFQNYKPKENDKSINKVQGEAISKP